MKRIYFEEKGMLLLEQVGMTKSEFARRFWESEDVPVGESLGDIESRRRIISQFYRAWKLRNPSLKKFNLSLNEDINIRFNY